MDIKLSRREVIVGGSAFTLTGCVGDGAVQGPARDVTDAVGDPDLNGDPSGNGGEPGDDASDDGGAGGNDAGVDEPEGSMPVDNEPGEDDTADPDPDPDSDPDPAPMLVDLTGTAFGPTAVDWGVTSDTAGGTIFAAIYPAGSAKPSANAIEFGGAGIVQSSSDFAPTADANNGGRFEGLRPDTEYKIVCFQRSASGVDGPVVELAGTIQTAPVGDGSVTIAVLQNAGLAAPQGAFFEARVSGFSASETLDLAQYDASFARLRYRWTVTRNGQAYTPRPSPWVQNLADAHNDTNTGYGKRFAHVFTEPGTYTVTCEVRDNEGTTGLGSEEVQVADPDQVFYGDRTILVGSADGAHAGAQVVGSTAAAVSALASLGQTGRILLERGSTHVNDDLEFGSNVDNVFIGTYGSGPRPIVGLPGRHGVRINGSFAGHVQVAGLELRGSWDSTSESGDGGGLGVSAFQTSNEQYAVFTDLEVHGWSEGIFSPRADNENVEHATYIHECNVYGNRFYAGIGIVPIAIGSFYAVTGCYLGSQRDDMMGGPKDGNYNNHGSIRLAAMKHCYIAVCDLFTRCGWNPTTAVATARGPFIQSCIRWNTSNRPGMSGVFERLALEGGFAYSAGGNNSYGSNLLVEKCLFVGHSSQRNMVTVQSPGLTFRNNVCVHPNSPTSTNSGKGITASGPQGGTTQHDSDWPVEVYSNTAQILVDNSNLSGNFNPWGLSGFTNQLNANNIFDAPNVSGQGGEAGLNLTENRLMTAGGVHECRWRGAKFRASSAVNGQQLTMDGTYASPADTVRDLYPGAGSTARGSASGVCAIDDFYGVVRPVDVSARARGAIEPA
ncbi:MAG: hypothetical protein AAF654_14355 [Myxococcota bacterium]